MNNKIDEIDFEIFEIDDKMKNDNNVLKNGGSKSFHYLFLTNILMYWTYWAMNVGKMQ